MGGGGPFAAATGGVLGSGSVGGSRGAGGAGLLCLGLSLCRPRTGTKAGFVGVPLSLEGVVSILLRFVSARHCWGAVRGGRHGAPLCTGGWLAGRLVGWLAPQVTLETERTSDGQGARGAWALWRSAPGAEALQAGRGGRGRPLLAWRGRSAGGGGGGGEGGRAGVVQSLCPPSAPRLCWPAAAGGGLKAQAQASPSFRFPPVPGRGSASPGPLLGGHCLLVPCDARVAGGGLCGRGALCAPLGDVPDRGCLASSGARRGPGG